jgi:hypothetical protein
MNGVSKGSGITIFTQTFQRWLILALLAVAMVARADHYEDGENVDTTGTLEVIRVDDFSNRRSEVFYYLVLSSGDRVPLNFDHVPENVQTGSRVRVRGVGYNKGLYVAAANGGGMQVVTAAATAVSGTQPTIVMLVNLLDASVSCSVGGVSNMMFSPVGTSVDGLYRDTSYGNVSFSGDVVGPFTISYSVNPCDATAWANAADSAATAAGINLANYTRKVYVLPSGTCIYGLGTIGGNPSRSWIGDCGGNDVYAHELGHNLGMHHSGTDQNNDGTVNDEYADTSDFMGYGGVGWRQVNAPHKVQMGWLPTNKIVTITGSGTYQVSALEINPASAAFAQTFLINIPGSAESYYLSYRTALGYDTNLNSFYTGRLQVHRFSSGAVITRFISALQDNDTFADTSVGIEVRQTSHDANGCTFTVTFGVPALPSPWQHVSVGENLGGSATYSSGTFSVSASGGDIWGTGDGFHYAYRTLSGDGEIIARVTAQENSNPWAKSGVMIRETLNGDSKHATMMVTPANGFNLQYRSTTAGSSGGISGGALNAAPNNWVRLVRSGSTLTGYKSADGSSWTQVGSVSISMNGNVYVGLAVTSHDNNLLNTTTFDNVAFGGSSAGTGLVGDYFDNSDFTGTKITRTDATVNFDWGSSAPMTGIGADTFSVRWNGQVQAVNSETYTFYTTTDDGVRLWVNNQLIIDKWIDQGPTEWSGSITLSAGVKYDIKMEYYENGGGASAKLAWSSPSIGKTIVPQIQLYPPVVVSPPNAPTSLIATAPSQRRRINLSWTQSTSSGITQNKVYRSTSGPSGPYTLRATLSPTTTYTDTGLTSGQTYYYVVTAVNSAGESGFSNYSGATAR